MSDNFYMDDFYLDDFREKTVLMIKQLIIRCPMDDPLPDCPLSEFRELPLKGKFRMIEAMPLEELDSIVHQHYNCFQGRT
jgi:hypothetical protein